MVLLSFLSMIWRKMSLSCFAGWLFTPSPNADLKICGCWCYNAAAPGICVLFALPPSQYEGFSVYSYVFIQMNFQ